MRGCSRAGLGLWVQGYCALVEATRSVNDLSYSHETEHCMGVGQPPKESGDLMLRFGANNEMPVIGHHAIRKDWKLFSLERFNHNPLERIIVFRLLEQRQSSDCSIEHVEAYASRTNTGSSRHLAKLTDKTG